MTVAEQIRYKRYKCAYDAFIELYPFTLDDLDGEQWRDIAGYEEFYQISTFGRVKSFCRGKVTILKPVLQRFGYLLVDLYKDGRHKSYRVHILVAKAFIPNPDNKPEVNHTLGNKLDCSIWNLEWVTSAENHKHASKLGLKKSGEETPRARLTNEDAEYCRKVYIPRYKEFGVRALARKFNVNHKTISKIIQGKMYIIAK